MGVLKQCTVPGCETWTLGGRCVTHELEPLEEELRIAVPGSAVDRLVATLRSVSSGEREDDACRPGDARFEDWLHNCRGFRVITPSGRFGTVACTVHISTISPPVLLIRTGLFKQKLVEAPVESIEWIIPAGRRVLLGGQPR